MEEDTDLTFAAQAEEKACATVMEPPFLVNEVEPFAAWPHGGVAIYVQYPFLLEDPRGPPSTWVVTCRKVATNGVGGAYEAVFERQTVRPAAVVAARGPTDPERTRPYDTARAPTEVGRWTATWSAGPPGAGALPAAAAPSADGRATSGPPTAAAAVGPRPADAAAEGEVPSEAGSEEGSTVAMSRPAAGAQTGADTGWRPRVGGLASGAPPAPADYFPLSPPLRREFLHAVRRDGDTVEGGLDDEEPVLVALVGRSPEAASSVVVPFACDLDVGRWPHLPSGFDCSDGCMTLACPARDPAA